MSGSKFRRLTDSLRDGGLLVPHLERALVTIGDAWPEEYPIRVSNKERAWDGRFHPSSHCAAPELQLYYELHPEVKLPVDPPSADQVLTWQVGRAYHALVQSMLVHMGFTDLGEIEVPFTDDARWCSGTVDVRRLELPDGTALPVEIKSAAWVGREPPEQYVQQLQVYMDLACGEPQELGLLLFLQKQSPHRFREFVVRRDERLLEAVYRKWRRVLEAIEFDDPSMLDWPCHEVDSRGHRECPARFVCRLGPPTGERPRYVERGSA